MMGREPISEQELEELLWCLIDWDALELCEDREKRELLIPYVMNDAVEYYLCLTGCAVHGELDEELEEGMSLELVQNATAKGLILRQVTGNTVSIWYDSAFRSIHCYQYHLIGHAWRKKSGEEYIRRLVNLVCVVHDKKAYLGTGYCNGTERWLADLAEFAPLLYFTPINESILDWYPESVRGIAAFQRLVQEAGDAGLLEELTRYENLFLKGKIRKKQIQRTAELLLQKDHACFWRCLEEKLRQASRFCEVRDYGGKAMGRIEEVRRRIVDAYKRDDFQGEYPCLFHQDENGKTDQELIFAEEQPFLVMEAPDFQYRIFSMRISSGDVAGCEWKEEAAIPE